MRMLHFMADPTTNDSRHQRFTLPLPSSQLCYAGARLESNMKRWLVLAAMVLTWALAAHGQETFKTRLSPVPIDAQLAPTVTGHGSVSAVLAGSKGLQAR